MHLNGHITVTITVILTITVTRIFFRLYAFSLLLLLSSLFYHHHHQYCYTILLLALSLPRIYRSSFRGYLTEQLSKSIVVISRPALIIDFEASKALVEAVEGGRGVANEVVLFNDVIVHDSNVQEGGFRSLDNEGKYL